MNEQEGSIFESGDLTIDLNRRVVTRSGENVAMTRTEWSLLACLAAKAGDVVPATVLLAQVWGPEFQQDRMFLRTWISRIRARLEPDLAHPRIITQDETGYAFLRDG